MASSSSEQPPSGPAIPPRPLKAEVGGGDVAAANVVMTTGAKKGGGGGGVGQKRERVCTAKDRISRMPPCAAGKRSSIYRGVTRHRWTGRYEAHLWDKSTWNQNQNKKGKQVYLGAYDDEEAAARAYDLAALKYWGAGTLINFPVSDYARDLEEMQMVSKEEYLVSLRRKSSAFSRGFPKYRGVSRGPQTNRWEASIGQMFGSDCLNNLNASTSRDTAADEKYPGGFCMERKTDLTSYIRWWVPRKLRQADQATNAEDIGRELQALECSISPTEPYKLPSLGLPDKGKPDPRDLSALSILSRSAAFKSFEEKLSGIQDVTCNRKMDHGKAVQLLYTAGEHHRSGVSFEVSDTPVQRTPFSLAPLLSAPLRTSWNPVDPVPDPAFWASLVPPPAESLTTTVLSPLANCGAYNLSRK